MIKETAKQDSVLFVKHAYRWDTLKNEFVTKKNSEPSYRTLFLLSKKCDTDFFSNIPKTFTISTKNTTLYFNIQILKDTSPVISKFIEDNPNNNNYFINVTDDENVLMKIEQLYQGKSVIFKETDIPLVHQFLELLQIKNCPNYLKQKQSSRREFDSDGYHQNSFYYSPQPKFYEATVEIYLDFFLKFLKRDDHQAFKIKTNKKEYVCNIFAVYTSKVIKQILEKDPTTTEFVYNFDDTENEFQLICDFFNYKKIDLKKVNIDSIKSIAEDLQISCILTFIDDYYDHCRKSEQKIEKHKKTIETIGELFDLLYNIKKYGIEKVKDSIVQSKWTKTEEDVQELAAFILQVIKPSFSIQKEISELIIQLSKESNDQNKLNILIPFIVDQLMTLYWPNLWPYKIKNKNDNAVIIHENQSRVAKYAFKTQEIINLTNKCVYSFIRILYKRGVIPKEEIENRLKNYDLSNNVINSFFFPELIKFHPMNKFEYMYMNKSRTIDSRKYFVTKGLVNTARLNYFFSKIVKKYLPDKIDLYEKMLDEMEPDDELTRILRHDDFDELQKILMKDEAPTTVPYNIFDDFEEDLNLLNYAAYTGSLKCFKYLMSNNNKIDESTFYFAVCGGNEEIIKIVYQQTSFEKEKDVFRYYKMNDIKYLNINGEYMMISFWFIFNRSDKTLNEIYGNDNFLTISNDKYNDGNVQYYKYSENGDFDFIINYSNINNIIAPSIALNKNDLFDFIFENVFVKNNKYENDLINIALLSAICGNVHSLITLIDNGLHISKEIISNCAKNGFYTLAKLLFDLFDEQEQINSEISYDPIDVRSIVNFGNLQIFQLFIEKMSQYDILRTILYAIERNYTKIVYYVFDNVDKFDILYNELFICSSLKFSTKTKSNELFDFLYEQYKKFRPELINIELLAKLLKNACRFSNFAVAKELTDLILKEKPDHDFKTAFFVASYSKSTNICNYFLEQKAFINFNKMENISDLGSVDIEIFEKIINNVDPNYKYLYYECINEAIYNKNMKLVEFILKENPPKDLELIEAVRTEEIEFVDLILKYNSEPSFVNRRTNEGSALCIAALCRSLEIIKRLLSIPGIDLNIRDKESYTPLTIAARNHDTEIVDEILKCYKNNNLQVPASTIASSMIWIFRSSHSMGIDAVWQIIKRLLEVQFVDANMYKHNNISSRHPLLIMACSNNRIDIVETYIRLNYDINVYDQITLNTPLMTSLELNFLDIARLLIKCPKTNINLLNLKNESALTIAIKNGQKEMIDLILNNEKFDPKASKLNQSFIFANNEISKQLIPLKFLDVNEGCLVPGNILNVDFHFNEIYMKSRKINALIFSVLTNNVDKIDMIINHPSFNIVTSRVKKAIFAAAKTNNIVIFRKLFKLVNNDINIRCDKKESLISYAAIHQSGDIVDEIINGNDQIGDAFVKSYSIIKVEKKKFQSYDYDFEPLEFNNDFVPIWMKSVKIFNQDSLPKISSVIEIMQKLLDYDLNHDHLINFDQLLMSGKSYFTVIPLNYSDIGAVCQFLIQHGVDPNKMDKKGVYPLEHAININSIDFVTSLVNSEKIDFNAKLKDGFTFLHLAAQNKDSSFLKLLLQKNKIDINSVNDDGETPLIIACKCNFIDNINLLFKSDELDYLIKNKNGKDALDIISNSVPQNELESIKQNKEKYHNKLISIIDEKMNSNS